VLLKGGKTSPDHAENFDYEAENLVFERTFKILSVTLGEQAFSRANRTRTDLIAGFGIYQYEAFTLGIQPHLNVIDIDSEAGAKKVRELFREIKLDTEFVDSTTGGGKNSPGPLNGRVGFVEKKLVAAYA